jgi:pfkB family carbohydrate kinase
LLRKLLDEEGVPSQTFAIAEETREDFFVSEISTCQPYRFILPGPHLHESEWKECLQILSRAEPFPRFVVASGSLPGGAPDDFYARLARIAKQRGARMIVDTSGRALAAAVNEGVDLIKPICGKCASWPAASHPMRMSGKPRPGLWFKAAKSPLLRSPWVTSARCWSHPIADYVQSRFPSRQLVPWVRATVFWEHWFGSWRREAISRNPSGALLPPAPQPY